MQPTVFPVFPIFLFAACVIGLAIAMLVVANLFNPVRPGRVKGMPYESGMDPFHDTHRRFDIRFYLLAIAFLVFDVELLFLYPWAVAMRPAAIDAASPAVAVAAQSAAEPRAAEPIDRSAIASEKGWKNRNMIFFGAMSFIVLLSLGFVYDWRKGVFDWR
jgi:NADH-quinone oxidoreductase subunit A